MTKEKRLQLNEITYMEGNKFISLWSLIVISSQSQVKSTLFSRSQA